MRHDFTSRKRVILGVLALLILADVALAAYRWQRASPPRTRQQQFAAEIRRHDLLKADIKRAQDIRDNSPAIQRDCDKFDRSLFPASSGYSSVTSELGDMAKRSSVHLADVTSKA